MKLLKICGTIYNNTNKIHLTIQLLFNIVTQLQVINLINLYFIILYILFLCRKTMGMRWTSSFEFLIF